MPLTIFGAACSSEFAVGIAPRMLVSAGAALADTTRWPADKIQAWYSQQRWLVGSNYLTADVINQLEMWQVMRSFGGRIARPKST